MVRRRLIPVLCAALALASCAGGTPSTVRIALGSAPLSLDPHLTNETSAFTICGNIYDTLVAARRESGFVPALAISWTNPDDVTWVLELRPGVRFHDGRALTSEDVAASLLRAKSDPRSDWKGALVALGAVETPSPHRVILRTTRPVPTLLQGLAAIAIVPADRIRAGVPVSLDAHPVGSGPYRFVSRDGARGAIRLTRWEGYYGSAPPVRDVEFRFVPEDRARGDELRLGAVDLIGDVPADVAERLQEVEGVRVLRAPGRRELFLAFDVHNGHTPYVSSARNPFLDRRVRQALLLAVDRERIARDILRGSGEAPDHLLPRDVFGVDLEQRLPTPDLAAARKLMREAGWPEGFEVTLDAPRGAYLEDARVAAFVAVELGALGIAVRVNALDKGQLLDKLSRRDTSFYMLSWNCLSGDAQEMFDYLLHTPEPARGYGGDNAGFYSNPELDRLSEEAGATMTPAKRLLSLQSAVRIAQGDVPWVPLYVQTQVFALRKPFRWTPRRDKRLRVDEIALEP